MAVTAKDILQLLETRHSKDVFVPECKNGASYVAAGEMLRMDAWVMPRSWSKPSIHCYEIKVSRADFLQDQKWRRYLPFCNQFWFAVSPGVCEKSEIPEGCGLVVSTTNGSRLFTKIKAPYREVTVPEDVFRYVLMCRANITREHAYTDNKLSHWRAWLADKEESREIGRRVSRTLQKKYERDVEEVKRENHRLEKAMKGYDKIAAMCDRLGIGPHQYLSEDDLREAIADQGNQLDPKKVRRHVSRMRSSLEDLEQLIATE